jgi:hypothetical protein
MMMQLKCRFKMRIANGPLSDSDGAAATTSPATSPSMERPLSPASPCMNRPRSPAPPSMRRRVSQPAPAPQTPLQVRAAGSDDTDRLEVMTGQGLMIRAWWGNVPYGQAGVALMSRHDFANRASPASPMPPLIVKDLRTRIECIDPRTVELSITGKMERKAGSDSLMVVPFAMQETTGTLVRMIPSEDELLQMARSKVQITDGSSVLAILMHQKFAEYWHTLSRSASGTVEEPLVMESIPFAVVALLASDSLCVKKSLGVVNRKWLFEFRKCEDLGIALEIRLADRDGKQNLQRSISVVYDHDVPGRVTFTLGGVCTHGGGSV